MNVNVEDKYIEINSVSIPKKKYRVSLKKDFVVIYFGYNNYIEILLEGTTLNNIPATSLQEIYDTLLEGGGSSYLPETQAVIDYGITNGYTLPSSPFLDKLNSHISDLKSFGLFDKLDLAYWMVGNGDLNFKTINIIDPARYKGTVTGLINEDGGIRGDGIGFIATGFIATGSENYTQNLAGRGVYIYDFNAAGASPSILAGISPNGTYNVIKSRNVGDSRINGNLNLTVPVVLEGLGYTALNRIDASTVSVNKELSIYIDPANPSVSTFFTSEHWILAGGGIRGTNGVSCYWSGSAIVGQDAINHRLSIINNL